MQRTLYLAASSLSASVSFSQLRPVVATSLIFENSLQHRTGLDVTCSPTVPMLTRLSSPSVQPVFDDGGKVPVQLANHPLNLPRVQRNVGVLRVRQDR